MSAQPLSAPIETRPTGALPTVPAVPVWIAAGASVVAGLVHYGVVPAHRAEWWLIAAFFTVLGGFQEVWAVLAWTVRDRWVLLTGAAVSLVALGVWLLSRTSGLPFGPEAGQTEPVGVADLVCVTAEVITVAAALFHLHRTRRRI